MSTVNGTVFFYGSAVNNGNVETAVFNDSSINSGTINFATFNATSTNTGSAVNATFNAYSVNDGTVSGKVYFLDNSINTGTVTGDAYFSRTSINSGPVTGLVFHIVYTSSGVVTYSGTLSSGSTAMYDLSGNVWSSKIGVFEHNDAIHRYSTNSSGVVSYNSLQDIHSNSGTIYHSGSLTSGSTYFYNNTGGLWANKSGSFNTMIAGTISSYVYSTNSSGVATFSSIPIPNATTVSIPFTAIKSGEIPVYINEPINSIDLNTSWGGRAFYIGDLTSRVTSVSSIYRNGWETFDRISPVNWFEYLWPGHSVINNAQYIANVFPPGPEPEFFPGAISLTAGNEINFTYFNRASTVWPIYFGGTLKELGGELITSSAEFLYSSFQHYGHVYTVHGYGTFNLYSKTYQIGRSEVPAGDPGYDIIKYAPIALPSSGNIIKLENCALIAQNATGLTYPFGSTTLSAKATGPIQVGTQLYAYEIPGVQNGTWLHNIVGKYGNKVIRADGTGVITRIYDVFRDHHGGEIYIDSENGPSLFSINSIYGISQPQPYYFGYVPSLSTLYIQSEWTGLRSFPVWATFYWGDQYRIIETDVGSQIPGRLTNFIYDRDTNQVLSALPLGWEPRQYITSLDPLDPRYTPGIAIEIVQLFNAYGYPITEPQGIDAPDNFVVGGGVIYTAEEMAEYEAQKAAEQENN